MDFLKKYNLTDEELSEIIQNNDAMIIDNFIYNQKNACQVIEYLLDLGIDNISDMLNYRIDIFMKNLEKIKNYLFKKNIKEFVKEVNQDLVNLDDL